MSDIRLESLDYEELLDQPREWSLDGLRLGQINLLVGRNATGKSRVLNVIGALARLLSRQQTTVFNGNFDVSFSVDGKKVRYILHASYDKVIKEQLFVGDDPIPKLDRSGKDLRLHAVQKDDYIEYEPEDSEISAVARKDAKQHPYLLPLYEWGMAVRHYHFGSQLGKDKILMAIRSKRQSSDFNDDRDEEKVVSVYHKGKYEFKKPYIDAVLHDMRELGYLLDEIDSSNPDEIELVDGHNDAIPAGAALLAMGVREQGIGGMYHQMSMSQGMFRALSIFVQVNYSQLSGRASCILIDDIGEGLDYERASKLIEILRSKAKASQFQLIMSTNDQFVMNHVPLDEWSILQRNGHKVSVRNIHNAKKAFEDFRFVGMSNFAFFEMDFINASQEQANGQQPKLGGASEQ